MVRRVRQNMLQAARLNLMTVRETMISSQTDEHRRLQLKKEEREVKWNC